jgi:lipoprotein-releasing system permease protein
MNYRNIATLAYRQLITKKRQLILTVAGISVGVMVLITSISLMDGILQSFVQKIVDNTPHIIVNSDKIVPVTPDILVDTTAAKTSVNFIQHTARDYEDVIKNYNGISKIIQSDKRVTLISPVVILNEIASFGTLSLPLSIHGVIPSAEDRIEQFSANMTEGEFLNLEKSPDGMILGTTIAKDLSVRMGDRMQLTSAEGTLYSVRVIGVFSTGLNEVDKNAYINLRLAQNIGGFREDEISKLYLRVSDLKNDAAIAREAERKTNYQAATWEENAKGFLSLFKMITMIVYFLTFFVILVSGFSVANVLITNVMERVREIAVLKSIGFMRNEVMTIFVLQGLIDALIGAAVGSILGFGMIELLASIPVQGSKSGAIRSDHLAMGRSLWYFVSASGFAISISLLASIGPSRNAAKVNPIEILRGER